MNSQAMSNNISVVDEPEARTAREQFTRAPVAEAATIREGVAQALQNYLDHLDGEPVSDVYNMVLAEVEVPLLEAVMQYTRKNQTKAANMLGLNRGTLRKKLKQYDML